MKHLLAVVLIAFGATICVVQEASAPEAGAEDQSAGIEWLKQFEGTWATDFDGTMESRIVGGRWVTNEFSFADGPFALQTLGYDAKSGKFVGTWVDATSGHIWHYVGSLDEAGKVLVLDTEGPDLRDATRMRKYRDSYEFGSADEIAAVSQLLNDDKQWETFNEGTMKRK